MAPDCGHVVEYSIASAMQSAASVGLFIMLRRPVLRTNVGSRHPHRPGSRPYEQLPPAGATDNADVNYVAAFSRPSPQRPRRRRDWHTRYLTARPLQDRT